MTKMTRLSKSGIEYLDYVWNFYSGCQNKENGDCPVGDLCWARHITHRFKDHYPNGFKPTFYPNAFLSPLNLQKPSRIGVAFMGDLFGGWNKPDQIIDITNGAGEHKVVARTTLRDIVFSVVKGCPQHSFLFLTKCPWNLQEWGTWPDNCWVGASVCNDVMFANAADYMRHMKAKIKFISFEPLLGPINTSFWDNDVYEIFQWFIIGAYTGTQTEMMSLAAREKSSKALLRVKPISSTNARTYTYQPDKEWVQSLVNVARDLGIPVFLKDNLVPLFVRSSAEVQKQSFQETFRWALNSDNRLKQNFPGAEDEGT